MSTETAIRVDGLGKKYRLGLTHKGTLRDAIHGLGRKLFRRSNGSSAAHGQISNPKSEIRNLQSNEFWALRDVSIDVRRGEVLGVIGRNGAGKSTLLKILSQVTKPSTGRAEIYGRVGSLLEVGTGFHPELTGRENVYLNGAILGMTKREIGSKFDEIVDFAGVEKFIDTPVKRYSSGMKVRLGFAVAAHLEPEILIVDEVLSVGDMQFQKKCLSKIDELKKRIGCIVLVSHNMITVRAICSRVLLLADGNLIKSGNPSSVIPEYERLSPLLDSSDTDLDEQEHGLNQISITNVEVLNSNGKRTTTPKAGERIKVVVDYVAKEHVENAIIYVAIRRPDGFICTAGSTELEGLSVPSLHGDGSIEVEFPELSVIPGHFLLDITFYDHNFDFRTYFLGRAQVPIEVSSDVPSLDDRYGVCRLRQSWTFKASQLPDERTAKSESE